LQGVSDALASETSANVASHAQHHMHVLVVIDQS
jgi:hypothetical protein